MKKVVVVLWIALLMGTLVVTPEETKATDVNWWAKSYGVSDEDEVTSVAIAFNGDIIIGGVTESFGNDSGDFWILRLDSSGDVIWQKAYGGSDWDYATSVTVADNGDIIAVGYTYSFGAGESDFISKSDLWVLRLDSNGNIKWQKAYGGSYWDYAASIAVAEGGDIIVAGNHLLRLSSDGELKWAKYIGGRAIKVLPDGTAVLAGGSFRVLRFNIDDVPTYSGWWGWRDVNLEVHDTNAEVKDTSAMVKTSKAQIQETSAEVHDTDAAVKTLWVSTLNKATLKINSKPFGAEVYINGTYEGKTPLTIKLEPGRYTVRVTEEGYEDYTTTVTLEAGETREITVQLKKKPTTTSKSHTYSQTTSTPTSTHTSPNLPKTVTTTKSRERICGPALILGLAMIPLLRRRR